VGPGGGAGNRLGARAGDPGPGPAAARAPLGES
jgi:hypothetical protein